MIRFVSFVFLLATTLNASAQSNLVPGEVRVQVNVNYVFPVSGNENDVLKAQENARRALYSVADKECTLLRETIAKECRLENINVNVNRQRHPVAEAVNASAGMTFRIQLK